MAAARGSGGPAAAGVTCPGGDAGERQRGTAPARQPLPSRWRPLFVQHFSLQKLSGGKR